MAYLLSREALRSDGESRANPAKQCFRERQSGTGGFRRNPCDLQCARRLVVFSAPEQHDATALMDCRQVDVRERVLGRMNAVVFDGAVTIRQHFVERPHLLERFERTLHVVPNDDCGDLLADRDRHRLAIMPQRVHVLAAKGADLPVFGDAPVKVRLGHSTSIAASQPWVASRCCSHSAVVRGKFPIGVLTVATALAAAPSDMSPNVTRSLAAFAASLIERRMIANR